MAASARGIATRLFVIIAMAANVTPALAWNGHHNSRSYRGGRGYNRFAARTAAVQRASAALNIARIRLATAQSTVTGELKRTRQQAQNSPALISAKSDYAEANRDSETARAAAVARLKETNPAFRDMLAKCQSLRQQIATLAKSGDTSGKMPSLESELRGLARKTILMEDQALGADATLKEANSRKSTSHLRAQSVEAAAISSSLNDPKVKAAQTQLARAQLQARQASARYSQALAASNMPVANYGRSYYRSRVGYRRYRAVAGAGHRHHAHRVGHRRRH